MNSTVSLVRYAKLPGGWRRGKVVKLANGKLRHPYMVVGGVEVGAPQGRYQLVRYEGARPVYMDLGDNPSEALSRFRTEEKKAETHANAVRAAERAGLQIETENPAEPDGKTLSSLAADFLERHGNLPHRSEDSLDKYSLVTRTFLKTCPAKYPAQVKVDDVIRWTKWLQTEQGYGDRSRSNLYGSLRSFLKFCGLDPAKLIDQGTNKMLKSYTKKAPDQYTPEQVQALMDAAPDANEALLWDFFFRTGVRDSEARMVTRDDLIGLGGKEPTYHLRERDEYGQIKTHEERKIELQTGLAAKLKKWMHDNPTRVLVFGTADDKPNHKMLRMLKRTAHRAGLNCGRCDGCRRFTKRRQSERGHGILPVAPAGESEEEAFHVKWLLFFPLGIWLSARARGIPVRYVLMWRSYTDSMTIVGAKPKEYRLLVGIPYLNAGDLLLKGMKTLHKDNPFHFLVSLRSFIEYNRRGIWFLMWASEKQLRKAEHLTFKQAGSPPLTRMDAMLCEAMGAGKVSHLEDIVGGFNEPFIDALHALTHGNPISVRFPTMKLTKIFDIPQILARAEHEQNIFRLLLYRRLIKMPDADIWTLLKPIHDKPQLLQQEVLKAGDDLTKSGVKIEWKTL